MFRWLKAVSNRLTFARSRSLSLIANWLAGALWLIDAVYLKLAKEAYGGNAIAYSCVRLLSQSIPEAPLKAYTEKPDGTREELPKDHPLVLRIKKPNELQTEYEFWELTTIHLAIAGHSFWWKQRSQGGEILNLWPLRPDRVGPIYSDSDKPGERVLAGWSYQDPGSGNYIPIPRRDMLAFNLPDPADESGGMVEGLGPLQVLSKEISADNEATSFTGALLKNYATPSLMIKLKQSVRNEDDVKMIKAKASYEFGGENRGTVGVVDGDADVSLLGFSLQQLEFPDLRAVAESRIAAAVGVPAILVGLKVGIDRSTYSNFDTARRFFAETTCSAYWRRYADQFTEDLSWEYGEGIVCEFDTSDVKALAGQRVERITPVKEAFAAGVATRDEYREVLGLEPDPIHGMEYLVPNTVTAVRSDEETPPPVAPLPVPVPSAPGPAQEGEAPLPAEDEQTQQGVAAKAALKLAADPQDMAEESLADILKVVLADVGETVLKSIRAGEVATDAELEAAFLAALHPALTEIAMGEMLRLGGEMGIPFDPAEVRGHAAAWAKDYTYKLVKGITATTRNVIADAVSGYMSNTSMTMEELKALLEPAFGKVRAQMIATTETTRSFAAANDAYRKQLLEQHGIKTDRVWYTRDTGACAICLPLDGQHEKRTDGSGWGNDHPGGPPLHVSCRCRTAISVVKDKQ